MRTPFLGGTYQSRSKSLAYSRCVNIYPEIVETKEGKDVAAFYGTDGLSLLATIGIGPIRGTAIHGNLLYVVSGQEIYSVDLNWAATLLGTPFATSSGPVSIQANTTQILFSDGVIGVSWDGTTLTTVTLFPTGGQVLVYQDGYVVTNVYGTQKFYQSNVNDVTTWKTSGVYNFSSADSTSDNIISLAELHRELWIMKSTNTEIWINAGLPNFVFQRLTGVRVEMGCIAPFSPASVGETIMWLGRDTQGAGCVVQTRGYVAVRKSTHAIEEAWQAYPTMSDAIAYSYQQQGHSFYVITFPSGDATWVFDSNTGMWHERAYMDTNGQLHRHRSNCHTYFNGVHVVGDYQNGNIYKLDPTTYTDNSSPKKWVRTWRAFEAGKQPYEDVTFDGLKVDMQKGLSVPDALDPTMVLRWSNDSGNNWSNEMIAHVGKVGETAGVVNFRRLGSTSQSKGKDRVFELSGSNAIPVCLIAADMDVSQA